jgi:hypothetical protein
LRKALRRDGIFGLLGACFRSFIHTTPSALFASATIGSNMSDWIKHLEPIQLIYGITAVAGGIARYLNSYVQGKPFKISIFFASAFTAGFSGYMFAILGLTMNLPPTMLFVVAGTGGFFGEQTMKLVLESVSAKLN